MRVCPPACLHTRTAQEDEKRRKKSIYDEDQTLEWRGGLAQKRAVEERRKAMEAEVGGCERLRTEGVEVREGQGQHEPASVWR